MREHSIIWIMECILAAALIWVGVSLHRVSGQLAVEGLLQRRAYEQVRGQFLVVDEAVASCRVEARQARMRVLQLERILSLHDGAVLRTLASTPAPEVISAPRIRRPASFPAVTYEDAVLAITRAPFTFP